jgi:hypothetical protein
MVFSSTLTPLPCAMISLVDFQGVYRCLKFFPPVAVIIGNLPLSLQHVISVNSSLLFPMGRAGTLIAGRIKKRVVVCEALFVKQRRKCLTTNIDGVTSLRRK